MIVIGIDPGTGASSPTGVFVYDTDTLDVLLADEATASHRDVDRRIKIIVDKLRPVFEALLPEKEVLVCIEYFVMQGKAGEMLHRLIGGVVSVIPEHFEIMHIQNSTVKLLVAGHGAADKVTVATNVLQHFKDNEAASSELKTVTFCNKFDIMDAAAIAIAGFNKWQNPLLGKKKTAKKARKKRP